ncbi:hypothetical protein ABTX15_04355 [Micromonospora sp. NPDC094482]|uniref:hypothetical protein n=1 Tax=unclassified Micromonospora TaxID=2617518 RepID=UPI003330859D
MVMVNLPAARRHHRFRIGYAFGLLALFGAATTMVVVIRDPALSATHLPEPVPAPEITVIGEGGPPDVADEPGWAGAADPAADPYAGTDREAGTEDGTGTDGDSGSGAGALAGQTGSVTGQHSAEDIRRSLFWSGIIGLTISLAGLGLVSTRRRMW